MFLKFDVSSMLMPSIQEKTSQLASPVVTAYYSVGACPYAFRLAITTLPL